jgi:hypothetical protein
MPPEQDDPRTRQIEALRRYVNELGFQQQRPEVHRGRGRPSFPWLLLTGVLVALALVGGVLVGAAAWSDDRAAQPRGSGTLSGAQSTSTSVVLAAATPECKEAVDQANKGLASAVKLRAALAEHIKITDDLLNGRIDRAKALKARIPSMATGEIQSARFDAALADYRKVVDKCRLQAP